MATVTAIAFNLFETIGLVQPRIEVVVREPGQCVVERQLLRMHWAHETDSNGRRVIRIRWVEDKPRDGVNVSCAGTTEYGTKRRQR
jgi:hypothetical protein